MARRRRRLGSPNYFVGSQDNNGPYGAPSDALNICKFHYDPVTPGNSTFMLTNTLPTQPFNSILGSMRRYAQCIPQPNTSQQDRSLGLSAAAVVSICLSQLRHARVTGHESVGLCRHRA